MMAALGAVICCGKSDLTPAAEDNNGGQEQQSVETTLTLTSATSLQFSTERASVDVEFTCSDNWKARILPEGTEYTWVTAYPHSGKAGSGKVNISVTANNTLDAKAATRCGRIRHVAPLFVSLPLERTSRSAVSRLRFRRKETSARRLQSPSARRMFLLGRHGPRYRHRGGVHGRGACALLRAVCQPVEFAVSGHMWHQDGLRFAPSRPPRRRGGEGARGRAVK